MHSTLVHTLTCRAQYIGTYTNMQCTVHWHVMLSTLATRTIALLADVGRFKSPVLLHSAMRVDYLLVNLIISMVIVSHYRGPSMCVLWKVWTFLESR